MKFWQMSAALAGCALQVSSLLGARQSGGARPAGERPAGERPAGAQRGGAQLDGAQLDGAQLDGAQLDGAQRGGVQLDGVQLDETTEACLRLFRTWHDFDLLVDESVSAPYRIRVVPSAGTR